MELGEIMHAVTARIIAQAEQEMNGSGVPLTLRPIVMECVRAHFATAAYDHLVAVRLKADSENTSKVKEAENG